MWLWLLRWLPYGMAWVTLSGLLLGIRARWGLDAPLGSDAPLWGLSAMALARGMAPYGAPLYPALVALCPGPAWWWGGVVSALCFAAVPPALVAILCRQGVSLWLAVPLGLAPLLSPLLVMMGLQLQPDALTQLLLLLVVAAGLWWDRLAAVGTPASRRSAAVGWLGAGLLLVLTREHGVIVLPMLVVALLLRAGLPLWAVLGLGLAGAAGVWWGSDVLPARLQTPLQSSPLGAGRYPLPEYMTHFRGEKGRPLVEAWNAGNGLLFWRLTLGEMLRRSAYHLLLVALGAAGFVRAQRWSGLVALSPALALLFFWSHERHSAVLVPAALVGMGLLLHHGLRTARGRALGLAGLLALAAWPAQEGRITVARAQGSARHSADLWRLTQQLQGELGEAGGGGPWLLAGLENEANLYLGWPRHVPILPQGCAQARWDGAAWRSLWIAPSGLMSAPMEEILRVGHMAAYRLPAEGERPCGAVVLPEGPLYVRGTHEAAVEGRCLAEVPTSWREGLPTCPDPR